MPTAEVASIVETVAATTRDFLRPFIIRESSVDELCRVIAALSEDVRSQMLGTWYRKPLSFVRAESEYKGGGFAQPSRWIRSFMTESW